MGDVWRNQVPRVQRRTRALGTIDGRLVEYAPVPKTNTTRRPSDTARRVHFNSGTEVQDGEMSPPYIVSYDCILVGLTLSVETGSVVASVYVNGVRKTTISHSGGSNYSTKEDLDFGVEDGDEITVKYALVSGTAANAITTVVLLED